MHFPFQSVTFDIMLVTGELGISQERPIYFDCKLNEPMHIGMQYLTPMGINKQQVQHIFSFWLQRSALFIYSALRRSVSNVFEKETVLLGGASFLFFVDVTVMQQWSRSHQHKKCAVLGRLLWKWSRLQITSHPI